MAATLNHPNIVTIYDRGDFEGQLWIAMEFVDGTDAAHLLTDLYPHGIPATELVDIVAGVAAALDYAHSRGVLHRDIKLATHPHRLKFLSLQKPASLQEYALLDAATGWRCFAAMRQADSSTSCLKARTPWPSWSALPGKARCLRCWTETAQTAPRTMS